MYTLSIRKILLGGGIIFALIWGVVFSLAFTDSSYQLFVPEIWNKPLLEQTKTEAASSTEEGPWKQDLFMGSGNLASFDGKSFLVHGTATPSAIYKGSEIVVYFNYFPQDKRRAFGLINWIKSSDQGKKWTSPSLITIDQSQDFSISPFSPKAVVMPNGKIKLYFLAKKDGETKNKLYAAVSEDGARFTLDSSTVFEIEDENLATFTLAMLDDKIHLLAYTEEGGQTGNSYHAISYDGKVFTRLADVKIQDSTYGQSSLIVYENRLVLIGSSAKGLWSSSSSNGNSWSSPSFLSFNAQNPAVLKIDTSFKIFYTDITTPDNN